MSELCVIFDLDGTLVDSEGLCNQAYLDLLPGLPLSVDELVRRFRGRKMAAIVAELEVLLDAPLPQDFVPKYREHVARLFATALLPMPGVVDMLRELHVPCCIASSGPMAKIRDALTVTGLLERFDQRIFSAYDVGVWKPEPGLFLHAAKAMGFPPERCLVVEDSAVGIEAARAAGMPALHYLPADDDLAHPYAARLSHMSHLPMFVRQHEGLLSA